MRSTFVNRMDKVSDSPMTLSESMLNKWVGIMERETLSANTIHIVLNLLIGASPAIIGAFFSRCVG